MEELIIILILIFVFGFGINFETGMFEDVVVPDIRDGDWDIEDNKIAGNSEINIIRENENIKKKFREEIAGNSTTNIITKNGNIYVVFEEKISGNADINIESERGNIFVKFERKVTNNVDINIKSDRGNIVFVNDEYLINDYINKGVFNVSAGGNVRFKNQFK